MMNQNVQITNQQYEFLEAGMDQREYAFKTSIRGKTSRNKVMDEILYGL
jgi:hypothetical protein